MNININIKSIGYNVGTSGWLKAQLESGAAKISEGLSTKSKNHGLWLHYDNNGPKQVCIAIWDQYSLGGEFSKYTPCQHDENDFDYDIFTPAVKRALRRVALSWCEEVSASREEDTDFEINLVKAVIS